MHASFLVVVIAARVASVLAQSPSAPSQPLPTDAGRALGAVCNPAIPGACANGVDCFATNFMLMPRCGNFQAICTSDAQCAFNTCNRAQKLCNGMLATSSSPSPSPGPGPGPSSPSSPAPTGTGLPLGADCSPSIPGACANGVDCYATNFMLTPRCGNFQATCTSNSQCFHYTCNKGACNGSINGTASPDATPTASPTKGSATASVVSSNSSATGQTSNPTAFANDATHMSWSLAGLLTVASLIAFAL